MSELSTNSRAITDIGFIFGGDSRANSRGAASGREWRRAAEHEKRREEGARRARANNKKKFGKK